MASMMSFKCACGNDYWESFHRYNDGFAIPDRSNCQNCRNKAVMDKVQSIKAELAAITQSPIALLLAEVAVLRQMFIGKCQIDEVNHWKAVLKAAKELTRYDDRKADQSEDGAGQHSQDSQG